MTDKSGVITAAAGRTLKNWITTSGAAKSCVMLAIRKLLACVEEYYAKQEGIE